MKTYFCPNCHEQHDIGEQVLGKLGGLLIGGAAGSASHDPWAALTGAIIGALIGHMIDETVLPKCPECGTILELIGDTIS